jgi:hypothetical protein
LNLKNLLKYIYIFFKNKIKCYLNMPKKKRVRKGLSLLFPTSSVSIRWRHFHSEKKSSGHAVQNQPTMLLAAPDCLTSLRYKPTFLFPRGSRSKSVSRTRARRLCKASLITNSDSFEVGRLFGSYGFMNITRYCLFTP